MAFDIDGARKAGYSDAEIADHLAQQSRFDAKQARKAGYSNGDIITHLAGQQAPEATAPQTQQAGPVAPGVAGTFGNLVAGAVRGAGSIGATILYPIDKVTDLVKGDRGPNVTGLVTGKQPLSRNEERRQAMTDALASLGADTDSTAFKVGKFGGEMAGTAGAGGVLANGMRMVPVLATKAAPMIAAVDSAGMAAPGLTGAKALAVRSAGGAVAGGASAGMVDPGSAGDGALIGALMPPAFKAAGITGDAFAAAVRPFFAAGQQKIVADTLRQYAQDPVAALRALKAAQQVIPGSAPTTAAASGDIGLAGLQRTMQNASGDFAAELATRGTNQNQARTAAMEAIAGNSGKIAVAKEGRDAATDAMREGVLQRAGSLDATSITAKLERMLADPNNAGSTARAGLQRALSQVRDIAGDSGVIDARALYEIRKDLGLAMNGKLQGDAGNLRFARGALDKVQSMFDDAIEAGSRRPMSNSRDLVVGARQSVPATGQQAAAMQAADAAKAPATGWRDYLAKYSELSTPINQMEALQDVLRRVQTGTTDTQGSLLLSAAKLNQILKNEGADLAKKLTPEQLQQLRNLAGDLNASQLAQNAGKASGSNTVQNLAQDKLLQATLGKVGASQPVQTTLGALLKLPYVRANQNIQQRLGEALLNPQEAARLLDSNAASVPRLSGLLNPAAALAYRGAPLLPATRQ